MESSRPPARVHRQELKLFVALFGVLLCPYPALYVTARSAKLLVRWRHYSDDKYDHFIAQGRGRLGSLSFRVFTPLRKTEQKLWSWIERD